MVAWSRDQRVYVDTKSSFM